MKNTPLCIYDSDKLYLERLSRYLMGKSGSPFIIKTYCGDDMEFIKNIKEGFLVISSSLLREEINHLKSDRVLILAEGEISKTYEQFRRIDKYQPAARLYEILLQSCFEREDVVTETGDRQPAALICVYSPVGRIGKSKFAANYCIEKGKNKKILLMNFEEFSKEEDEREGLSELLYFYKSGRKKIAFELERLVCHEHSYDRVLPASCVMDLIDMDTEEVSAFISDIQNCGLYDEIVIDINSMMWGPKLLSICDKIYVPYIERICEANRISQFEKMLALFPEYKIKEKSVKVKMILQQKAGG